MADVETEGEVVLVLRSFVAAIVQVVRCHSTSGVLVATRAATDPCDAEAFCNGVLATTPPFLSIIARS